MRATGNLVFTSMPSRSPGAGFVDSWFGDVRVRRVLELCFDGLEVACGSEGV